MNEILQSELPSHEQLYKSLCSKIDSLQTLSEGRVTLTLNSLIQLLQAQFDEVASVAERLEEILNSVSKQEVDIRTKIQNITDWLNTVRANLSRVDSTTGNDSEVLQRVEDARVC